MPRPKFVVSKTNVVFFPLDIFSSSDAKSSSSSSSSASDDDAAAAPIPAFVVVVVGRAFDERRHFWYRHYIFLSFFFVSLSLCHFKEKGSLSLSLLSPDGALIDESSSSSSSDRRDILLKVWLFLFRPKHKQRKKSKYAFPLRVCWTTTTTLSEAPQSQHTQKTGSREEGRFQKRKYIAGIIRERCENEGDLSLHSFFTSLFYEREERERYKKKLLLPPPPKKKKKSTQQQHIIIIEHPQLKRTKKKKKKKKNTIP